ncbi:MAG: hypothetical protein RLY93_07110 [Sumerlaeia bacterium]
MHPIFSLPFRAVCVAFLVALSLGAAGVGAATLSPREALTGGLRVTAVVDVFDPVAYEALLDSSGAEEPGGLFALLSDQESSLTEPLAEARVPVISQFEVEAYFLDGRIVAITGTGDDGAEVVTLNEKAQVLRTASTLTPDAPFAPAVASEHSARVLASPGLGHLWVKWMMDEAATTGTERAAAETPVTTPVPDAGGRLPALREPRGRDRVQRVLTLGKDGLPRHLTYSETSEEGTVLARELVAFLEPDEDDFFGLPYQVQTIRRERTEEGLQTVFVALATMEVMETIDPRLDPTALFERLRTQGEPDLGMQSASPLSGEIAPRVLQPPVLIQDDPRGKGGVTKLAFIIVLCVVVLIVGIRVILAVR